MNVEMIVTKEIALVSAYFQAILIIFTLNLMLK